MKERDINYPSWYELACWPDDLRGTGLTLFGGWHYCDIPYYDGITPDQSTYKPHPKYNASYVLEQTLKIFKQQGNMFYKSLMLRFFIHIVGDSHQPLHMGTRVSKEHRDGDRGGNLFKIKGKPDNLHALWDQVMGKIPAVKRPVNNDGAKTIEEWAGKIRQQYTRQKLATELAIKDVYLMGKMIHKYTESNAYKGIKENESPSENYKNTNFEICKKLIALAGYRLADLINNNL